MTYNEAVLKQILDKDKQPDGSVNKNNIQEALLKMQNSDSSPESQQYIQDVALPDITKYLEWGGWIIND